MRPKNETKDAGSKLLHALLTPSKSTDTALKQLCLAAWNDAEDTWGTPMPLDRWEAIADVQAGIPPETLKALVEAEDLETREKLARKLRRPRPRIDVSALTKAHMLAPDQGEAYSLRPRFMPWLLARDHVIDSMIKRPLDSWAFYCYDPCRRLVVDAALDALTQDDLIGIVKKLPDSLAGDAAGIAAAEALFYSIGRRAHGEDPIKTELLPIAPRLLKHLDGDNAPELPQPWSRETREAAAKIEWIATCWDWSLLACPEGLPARLQNSWLFPGWAIDLESAEDWGLAEFLIDDNANHDDASIRRILERAGNLVDRLAQPPAAPPAPLCPFLIAAGAKGRWPIEPDWWNGTLDRDWKEKRLIHQADGIPQDLLPRLLGSLIDHVAITLQKNKASYISFLLSPLRRAILRNFPSGTIGAALTEEQIRLLLLTPEALPPELRSEALELLLSSGGNDKSKITKLISLSTEADMPALLRWLETANSKLAAKRIWKLMPQQAKSILSNAKNEEPQRLSALLLTCPDLSFSLPLIRENIYLLEREELKSLARELLPKSWQHSRELMKLLTSY